MKKTSALFLLLSISLGMTAFHPVAEPFEGTIHYETSVTGEVPKFITERLAKYYDLRFKGSDLKIKGGAPLIGEILLKKKTGKMYIMRTDEKNIYELDLKDKRIPEKTSTSVATRLNEINTIAGYRCQKHQVQYDNGMKLFFWTTEGINTYHWGGDIFGGQFKLPEGINGYPLKLQFTSSQFTITCTATVVKAGSIDALEFELPSEMATKKL